MAAAQRAEKQLNQKAESFLGSLYIELAKDIAGELLYKWRQGAVTLVDELVGSVVRDDVRQVATRVLAEATHERRRALEQHKSERVDALANDIANSLFAELIVDECDAFLNVVTNVERDVCEDVLSAALEAEYRTVIRLIVGELLNEMLLDQLARQTYFESSESYINTSVELGSGDTNAAPSTAVVSTLLDEQHIHATSMYANDVHAFLHECVYEFTRLSLAVNRELYYELQHVIAVNRRARLFAKWRLKLSLKLLHKIHR